MDFKNRLKHCRDLKGYTLKYIADRVGVSEGTVQRWESGNIKSLRHIRIAKLSEVLGVSPAYLMGWDEDQLAFYDQGTNQNAAPPLTPHESTVITAYRKQPAMQPAVDKLLGVVPLDGNKPIGMRVAASGGGVRENADVEHDLTDDVDNCGADGF